MDTKKAIKTLNKVENHPDLGKWVELNIVEANKVIALLQQGEAYKKIVEELENCLLPEEWETVKILKQKYFPNEVVK